MSSSSSSPDPTPQNPNSSKWRYTWESQSHVPILKLFIFHPEIKPSPQCVNLLVHLLVEKSLLTVTFLEDDDEVSLYVPVPKVLVDSDAPVRFRALDDQIEVKLVLLLPVDDPIVLEYGSVVNLCDNAEDSCPRSVVQPLAMDSDIKKLSAMEEVHFYCRYCTVKLTRTLRVFEEMPSVNWRDVADNWFGTCCCSFGGISEKLVARYAESYGCPTGICLLDDTCAIISKDDILGYEFPDWNRSSMNQLELESASNTRLAKVSSGNGSELEKIVCPKDQSGAAPDTNNEEVLDGNTLSCMFPALRVAENSIQLHESCNDLQRQDRYHTSCCTLDQSGMNSQAEATTMNSELLENQKSFLNGYLGNGFMARSSSLSKDVRWIEFQCPQCACHIGAFPSSNDYAPLDGGVRFFKCYISTSSHIPRSNDLFRSYTLEKMFTSELLQSAKDELSFRTVVRDIQTNCPMLQVVLLNPNSWCSTGSSLYHMEPIAMIDMYPTIKVLFCSCMNDTEFDSRKLEEWVSKNQADEVYMFPSQIKELVASLEIRNYLYPPSHSLMQGLFLSSLMR